VYATCFDWFYHFYFVMLTNPSPLSILRRAFLRDVYDSGNAVHNDFRRLRSITKDVPSSTRLNSERRKVDDEVQSVMGPLLLTNGEIIFCSVF